MFKGMDLSDVQVISPSRGRFHKNYFSRENFSNKNYRNNKGRTFIDMDISDYPEFGTYFCPYENNEIDNRRYFIKFSTYIFFLNLPFFADSLFLFNLSCLLISFLSIKL